MLKKLWCPENNRILVCIDAYDEGNPRGRFYNALQEVETFTSLTRLLVKIEELLDDQRTPQSYTTPRRFAPVVDSLESGILPTTSRKGEKATFELRILFRQNTSWQGTVIWKEQKQEQSFRSVLELIHLMDSALRAEGGIGVA